MQKLFALFLFAFLLLDQETSCAQEAIVPEPEVLSDNIDSLIRDSLKQALILNHRPLTEEELSAVPLVKGRGFYGTFVGHFLYQGPYFALTSKKGSPSLAYKVRLNRDWIFYSFAFLFLFLGLLNTFFNGYLQKLFRAYINDGFILKQTREQLSQSALASFLFNVFCMLSGAIFFYIGLDGEHHQQGSERWWLLLVVFVFLSGIYLFKLTFLHFIGWVFNMQEEFGNYLFVVFVTNKVAGILLLFSSFLMAFVGLHASKEIFIGTLYLLGCMVLFRFVKAYAVFFRQAGSGLFSFVVAFISLELIPTAVLIKWLSSDAVPFLSGIF